MKLVRICLALCLILSLTVLTTPILALDDVDNAIASKFAPDRILVKFEDGTSDTAMKQVHAKHPGCKCIGKIKLLNIEVVKVPNSTVQRMIREYQKERVVEYAEPDYIVKVVETPNDTYFDRQWGMPKIQAPSAWDVTHGNSGMKIAILDTGIDRDHPDLGSKIVARRNFTSSRTFDDRYGHGTHVAGIAAAITNNSKGVAGVGYNCSLMNGKVLGDNGSGYTSWIVNGINWAVDPNGDGNTSDGAKVINMSFGGSSRSSSEEAAINAAWNKGVILVGAAGNSNNSNLLYPAAFTNCIAVAATDQNNNKASFSSYGNWVDVAAPGVSIFSTLPNHRHRLGSRNYGSLSGTSMATPHVAGLAGLVWSTAFGASNTSVRNRIEGTADTSVGIFAAYGIPRIDAFEAVSP